MSDGDYIVIDTADRVLNFHGEKIGAVITKMEVNDGLYGSRTSSLTIELTCVDEMADDVFDFVDVKLQEAYELSRVKSTYYLLVGSASLIAGLAFGLLIK